MKSSFLFSRSLHRSAVVRGALTSKPYAFVSRPWEITTIDGIDNFGSLGANIQLQARGNELIRVLPRTNDEINEDWIDDKTRFCFDGLKSQRLIKPLCRSVENPSQWEKDVFAWRDVLKRVKTAFDVYSKDGSGVVKYRAICGGTLDLFGGLALSDFAETFSENQDSFNVEVVSQGKSLNKDIPENYRFNSSILGLDEADLCLLVGTNFYIDSPLLCARLRKNFLTDRLRVSQIGFDNELTFPAEQLGLTPQTLIDISSGNHPFSDVLKKAEKPMVIVDNSVFNRPDCGLILKAIEDLAETTNLKKEGWNGINFFHKNANDVGLLELGRNQALDLSKPQETDILHLVQVQAADLPNKSEDVKKLRESSKFIIYQGSHGDELASVADVVLPSAAFHEKTGFYTNVEGRTQASYKAINPPGLAKSDWMILRAMSEVLGNPLPYDSEQELEARLCEFVPGASREGSNLFKLVKNEVSVKNPSTELGEKSALSSPFVPETHDFYLEGHAAARVSKVMAGCSRDEQSQRYNFRVQM